MEQLTIVYTEVKPDIWLGFVAQYPYIVAYEIKGKDSAVETMYHLVTEELFHKTKSLNSWAITKEVYIYLGAGK